MPRKRIWAKISLDNYVPMVHYMFMLNGGHMTPSKGMRFKHSRVLDTAKFDGKTNQLYQVTRIAQGQVWFAPVYDAGIEGSERLGKSERCALGYFPKIVVTSPNQADICKCDHSRAAHFHEQPGCPFCPCEQFELA
jgi:hypothetical protein